MVTMSLRYFTISAIIFFLVAGIFTRVNYGVRNIRPLSVENQGPIFSIDSLNALRAFKEPTFGFIGYEIGIAKCAEPFAALPIPTSYTSVIPSQYRFRSGDYSVLYLYNGKVYMPSLFSIRVRLMHMIDRVIVFIGGIDLKNIDYYFKIWYPYGCAPLSELDVAELQNGLIVWTTSD